MMYSTLLEDFFLHRGDKVNFPMLACLVLFFQGMC